MDSSIELLPSSERVEQSREKISSLYKHLKTMRKIRIVLIIISLKWWNFFFKIDFLNYFPFFY